MSTHMCMCMSTKTISIMDDAYMLLLRNKLRNESFSGVIRRHFKDKKGDIMKYAGVWKKFSDKDISYMKNAIEESGRRATMETLNKLKRKK